MYIPLTIFSGFTVLISIIMLGSINKKVGLMPTTLVNFSAGTIGSILILLFIHEFNIEILKDVPIYLYSGSVVVIAITMLNGTIINKIPAVYTTMLVFIGQLAAGMIIDYFRFNKFSTGDFIGGIVVLIGLLYNSRIPDLDTAKIDVSVS
ncbi:MAG: hypothetical protein CVU84_09825 [Firmicutes bacterium HGW-Firmicutes-1]|jgi:uncharacterized membrane protein YdcZ (DUF606 family)|nr:MAG: hypothetical protein CVU84_09825 [Firmicutes bacterium HGW-Firmicutes-1]